MKFSGFALSIILVVSLNGLLSWLSNLPQEAGPDVPGGKISSFSFAPFREGHSPLTRTYPTNAEIDEDMRMLVGKTRTIRTYSSLSGLQDVPSMARKHGLKLIQGAWLGGTTIDKDNKAEIARLIQVANEYPDVIERVIVGNEVLLRGELEPEELLKYIRQVKAAVKQPVSYADVWSFYLRYPEIAKEVDFFTVHILPYWEDEPLTVGQTARHIEKNYQRIRDAYPGKPILIGESGWPSAGRQRGWAVPSRVNEARFIRELVQVANKNGFDYNIVEAFNQPWKSKLEGVVGANWGLISVDRKPVFPLTGKVVENPDWPKRLLFAGLITALLLFAHSQRCLQLPPQRLLMLAVLAQFFGALLVNQVGDNWYTSYDNMERMHALIIFGLSALLALLMFRRALDLLLEQTSSQSLGLWIHYLLMAFIALALYKSQAFAWNGRYLSIPYSLVCIPVAGLMGLALIRFFCLGNRLLEVVDWHGLVGFHPRTDARVKDASWILLLIGFLLIAAETVIIMNSSNYPEAYPLLADRVYAAWMSAINNSQLPGWAMIIAAILVRLPLRAVACLLVLAVIAQIVGETEAFVSGHDFIEAYPDENDRLKTAFVYTISNCQLMLWLSCLLVLSTPLWLRKVQTP